MFKKSLRIAVAGLIISVVAAWAAQPVGPARLEGDVKDAKGQPVAGAEVHLRGHDGSGERIVKTDQTGHYGIGKLPVTDYEVILRSEEHTSELQSQSNLVCRLLL